jgi:hypothetical protein
MTIVPTLQAKNPNISTLPTYSPIYSPPIARRRKNLRAAVDNQNRACGDFSVI